MDELLAELRSCSPELISRDAAVSVAAGNVEAEKAKRLPSFSLSANGKYLADSSNDNSLDASARYTLMSFGKFEANEAFAERKLQVEQYSSYDTGLQQLAELLQRKSSFSRLASDIATLEAIVGMQQEVLDRVERRSTVALSSESDKNAVFSKVWQNKNRINENRLQQQLVKTELDLLACTENLQLLSLDALPKESGVADPLTQEFVNASIAVLDARLASKNAELEANKLSLRPDLQLVGSVPVDDTAKDNSSLGIEMNVSYGNMGRVEAARAVSLQREIEALQFEREVSNARRIRNLVSLEQRIMALRDEVIPNQQLSIDSVGMKLASKERLFKAGRVSLFELLSAYDELLSAQLDLNKFQAELQQAQIDRASSLDFIHR
jgi:outer membrane protein TolC